MALSYQPTAGRLLVKPLKKDDVTKGGIYIPDTANKEKPQEGEVIAVGPDRVTESGTVTSPAKVGNKVLFAKWGGEEYKDETDGIEYKFIKFEDIIAVATK